MITFKFNIVNEKSTAVKILVFLTAIVFYFIYVFYFKDEVIQMKTIVTQLNSNIKLLKIKEDNYNELEHNKMQINSIKNNKEPKIAPYTELPLQIMYLDNILDNSKLEKYELTLGGQQRSIINDQTIISVNADISILGSYHNIIKFINNLNDGVYTYNLGSILMNSEDGVIVNAEVEISMYCFASIPQTLKKLPEQSVSVYKNPFFNQLKDERSDFIE